MSWRTLPVRAELSEYQDQAQALLAGVAAGDPAAVALFGAAHPRFRDPEYRWLPRASDDGVRQVSITLDDAQLAVACRYSYRSWDDLVAHVTAATAAGSPVERFEAAAEAVIDGDLTTLAAALAADPELVHARSIRVCCFDPPVHRATLLHYVAANGLEGHRQRTPSNAVDVARTLLEAGAEVDALADLYGAQWTTMSLLVSSSHPAEAGVQVRLVELLVAHGASLIGDPPPLQAALTFGFVDAARALVRLGAPVADLPAAAGLGDVKQAAQLLDDANTLDRHRALALAAQLGHVGVVRLLLDAGEDPDRYNPPGFHPHATPLHHAALGGHAEVVALLVARGARLDLEDRIYRSTPAGWADHAGHPAIARTLGNGR